MTAPAPVDALVVSVAVSAAAGADSPATRLLRTPHDTHQTPDRTVAVLGRIRRPGGSAWTARSLVESGAVHADGIRTDAIAGNGLVVSVDRDRPVVHAYRTLLGVPQLYFYRADDALHLSTSIPELLARVGPLEPDPEATVEHFAFRFVLPPRTYYRGLGSLPGGHLLTWDDGALSHRRVQRLEPTRDPIRRLDADAVAWLDDEMRRVTDHYVAHAAERGRGPGTLLSGGVDSVLVHLWANEAADPEAADPGAAPSAGRSCSFTVPDAPSFRAESRRAMEAADRLDADHVAVPVAVADYPGLLEETVALLGRPSLFNEAWPCHLALGRAVSDRWGAATLFGGHCADGLHGLGELALVDRRDRWRRVPGLHPLLRAAAPVLARLGDRGEALAVAAGMGPFGDGMRGPTSVVSLAGELPLLREAFGDDAVRRAFDRRREQAADAAPFEHPWDRLHMTHYFAAGTEPSTAIADLYGAQGLDTAFLYRDDEVAAAALSFHPETRLLTRTARGPAVPGRGAPALKPLQAALLDARGLGALARVDKGGTTFWWDLWAWMTSPDGPLRDRVLAMERPDFLAHDQFRRARDRPSDFLWNLLAYDAWRRTLPARSATTP